MSQAYIGAIEDHCPNAKLVLDRFHIAKAPNDAIDEVRKEQWREASKDERKALKGLRPAYRRDSGILPTVPKRILGFSMRYAKEIIGYIEHGC